MEDEPVIIIGKHWKLGRSLGEGSFGLVHEGLTITNDAPVKKGTVVAIKLEHRKHSTQMLEHEFKVMSSIQNEHNPTPLIYAYGKQDEYRYLVMEMLGESLNYYISKHKTFTADTVGKIGVQILVSLEHLHKCSYVHRDIKPDNILVHPKTGRCPNHLSLIDYGISKEFKTARGEHCKRQLNKIIGTMIFCSSSANIGYELARKDDLISLGYLLIYFAVGKLPWEDHSDATVISRLKEECDDVELGNTAHKALGEYMYHVNKLSFSDKPNYEVLLVALSKMIDGKEIIGSYCWEKASRRDAPTRLTSV